MGNHRVSSTMWLEWNLLAMAASCLAVGVELPTHSDLVFPNGWVFTRWLFCWGVESRAFLWSTSNSWLGIVRSTVRGFGLLWARRWLVLTKSNDIVFKIAFITVIASAHFISHRLLAHICRLFYLHDVFHPFGQVFVIYSAHFIIILLTLACTCLTWIVVHYMVKVGYSCSRYVASILFCTEWLSQTMCIVRYAIDFLIVLSEYSYDQLMYIT